MTKGPHRQRATIVTSGNLFSMIPKKLKEEQISELFATDDVRIERIVSRGQACGEDDWYDEEEAEWVLVLSGSARLQFEGEAEPRRARRRRLYLHSAAQAPSRRLDRSRRNHRVARGAFSLSDDRASAPFAARDKTKNPGPKSGVLHFEVRVSDRRQRTCGMTGCAWSCGCRLTCAAGSCEAS